MISDDHAYKIANDLYKGPIKVERIMLYSLYAVKCKFGATK